MKAEILYAGCYSGRKSVANHFHRGIELVYSVSGHCANRTPAGVLHVQPGEVIVIPPKLQHRQIDFGEVETFYVVFELTGTLFSQTFRVIDLGGDTMTGVWFRQLYELYNRHCIGECSKLLELLLMHLNKLEQELPEPEEKRPQLLRNAANYITAHFQTGIAVQEVAEFCRCSESYLNGLFKLYYGKSICRCITELRLSQARRLLLHSPLSAKEISEACGYSRCNYFCRIFKQEHGCTPGEFRTRQGILDYSQGQNDK